MNPTTGYQDGPKIRRLREDRKLSVRQLAGQVGCHPQTMRNIELGRGTSLGLILKVASALDVQLPEIVRNGNGESPVAGKRVTDGAA